MADQDRPNQGTPSGARGPQPSGHQRPGDEQREEQAAGRAQGNQAGGQTPPKRTPRGAAGRTEAASRGGRRSAEVQVRDQYGQFAGRSGGAKKRDREEGGGGGNGGGNRPEQNQQGGNAGQQG